jgi:hypothetical protein
MVRHPAAITLIFIGFCADIWGKLETLSKASRESIRAKARVHFTGVRGTAEVVS